MPVDARVLAQIALSSDEYDLLVRRLGREPNDVELGMAGALWSEHCGYKNSKPLLRRFPTDIGGHRVLTRAGEENAGVIDVGDGWCVAFKIESHNHPSAIEPYQGAATGVGGIVRDIFAMGARPVAILDSLRFGPLDDPRNRHLFAGVVAGIGGYGNCLGVPTVGGEVVFAASYSGNPLVNALCAGIVRRDRMLRARAEGPGNPVLLVGADTGRDGIHGATFASVELDEQSEERRPAVQVGNPFLEKLLMEACVELAEEHPEWVAGLQDLGAAGLTSSAVECAARAGTGMRLDISRVPRREEGMTPYEVMLSESQERMLVVARRGFEERLRELFERWELHCVEVGVVTDDGRVRVFDGDRQVVDLPVRLLVDPPLYTREGVEDPRVTAARAFDPAVLDDLDPGRARDTLLQLLAAPNIASKQPVYRQYDHQVMTNTVVAPGADAAVLRIKGTDRGIALSTDGNGRYCYLDPAQGGAIAVAEAARNVACTGAEPVALTDCLNFGNPEKAEIYYQLERTVEGMSAAARALGTPVVSGNVSLYNETAGEAIYPTPVVGALGVLEDVTKARTPGFKAAGDQVLLLGDGLEQPASTLGGSEYLELIHGRVAGPVRIDLDLEVRLQRLLVAAVAGDLLRSAHDCSDGGLAVALAESAILGSKGLDAAGLDLPGRLDAALFGEAQSRVVVSVQLERVEALMALARGHGVPVASLGRVTDGGRFRLGPIDASLEELTAAYEGGLLRALRG